MTSTIKKSKETKFYGLNYETSEIVQKEFFEYFDFIHSLCKNVTMGETKELVYGQKVLENNPIIFDFTFKFKLTGKDSCGPEFINALCQETINYLKGALDVKKSKIKDIIPFVFETEYDAEEWTLKDSYRKGVRIFFPLIRVSKDAQRKVLRIGYLDHLDKYFSLDSERCRGLKENFSHFVKKTEGVEKWEKYSVCLAETYPFYGCKGKVEPLYSLKGYFRDEASSLSEDYDQIDDQISYKNHYLFTQEWKDSSIRNILNNEYLEQKDIVELDDDSLIDDPDNKHIKINFFPIVFTMNFVDTTCKICESVKKIGEQTKKVKDEIEEITILFQLLDYLNPLRFEKSILFKEVGKIIFFVYKNITKDIYSEEDGFDIWLDVKAKFFKNLAYDKISMKKEVKKDDLAIYMATNQEKFKSEEDDGLEEFFGDENMINPPKDGEEERFLRAMFNEFEQDNYISIRTIAYYAKKDNPVEYNKWHEIFCYPETKEMFKEISEMSVSKCFLKYNWLNLICKQEKSFIIYDENKHKFVDNSNNENIIKGKLFEYFLNEIKNVMGKNKSKLESEMIFGAAEDKNEEFSVKKEKVKNLDTVFGELKKFFNNSSSQNRVYNCLYSASTIDNKVGYGYHTLNITKVLNANINLTGVANGVIEVDPDLGVAEFREGKPEDFITFSSDVSYDKSYNPKHSDMIQYFRYMYTVFVDADIRKYMYKILASFLRRRNIEKKIYTLIGDTNGSKSIITQIISKCLGSYSAILGSEILTVKPKGESANPVLVQLKNVSVGLISEADGTTKQISSWLKVLTGGDDIQVRGMFKDSDKKGIECCFRLLVSCNVIPPITDHDRASKERNAFIPMESEFVPRNDKNLPSTIEGKIKNKIFSQEENIDKKKNSLAKAMLWYMVFAYKTYALEPIVQPLKIATMLKEHWKISDHLMGFMSDYMDFDSDSKDKGDESIFLDETEVWNYYGMWMEKSYENIEERNREKLKKSDFLQKIKQKDKMGKAVRKNINEKKYVNVWYFWKASDDLNIILKAVDNV
jgi:phage/plasmid-associated DNA primase/dsDNA-binding SOS-regulon protein